MPSVVEGIAREMGRRAWGQGVPVRIRTRTSCGGLVEYQLEMKAR